MPGIIFFIVFAIVILNILSRFARQTGRNGEQQTSGNDKKGNPKRFSSSPFLMVQKSKLNGVWMESAGEMGLSFLRPGENYPYPSIGGNVDNMQISVSLRQDPVNGELETHYKVLYPEDLGLDFHFVKAEELRIRSFAKGKKRWDKLDRELPAELDRKNIFLTAKDEKILESFLDKRRKESLFWSLQTLEELFIDDRSVTLIYQGVDDSCEEITSRIRLVLQLGRTFGVLSDGEKILYHKIPVENTEENTPSLAVDLKPVRPSVTPLSPLSPLPKVTFPAGDTTVKNEEKTFLPAGEKKGEKVEERKLENTVVPEEKTSPAAVVDASSDFTVEEMVKHLFSNAFAGNAEKEYFASCKGKSVYWKGTLQSAFDYSSDFLFGNGGGVKAKFVLMEYKKEGSFLTQKIFAVVSFPREDGELLRKSTGKEFSFRGKLFHFESISKEIMLSEGLLEK